MRISISFFRCGALPRLFRRIAIAVPALVALSGVGGAAEPIGSGKLIPHWGAPVWSEEFNVDGPPDPAVWGYQLASRNNPQERQYYTNRPENARVEGGALVLELHKDNAIPPGARDWVGSYDTAGGYTSGFIYSLPSNRSFLYGRIEFRAKLPTGPGAWPALWSTGNGLGWPRGGEIDVVEFWGNQVQPEQSMPHFIAGTSHWYDETKPAGEDRHAFEMNFYRCQDPSADWHLYAIEWDAQGIRYFLDDVYYAYTDLTPAGRNELATIRQVLRLNLAFDGASDSPITHLRMDVDYVREFQLQPGRRVHAPPSVGMGGNGWTGATLSAFTNQPLPLACTVEGDGMPGGGYTVEWEALTGPGRATFSSATGMQTSATFPVAGIYDVRAVGHDGQYGGYAWRRIVVTDGSGNTPPQVAACDRQVMAGHPVKLRAVVADDGLPGGAPTVTWRSMGDALPEFSDIHALEPTVTFNQVGTALIGVTASDGALAGTEAMVRVTVVAPGTNQAPQVSTAAPLSINLGDTITLPGTVSDDGLPEFSTTQQWTQVSGPTVAAIAQPTWVNSTATFNAGGTYVLRLTATDGAATTSADLTVNVSMFGNHAPVISMADPAVLACHENATGTVALASSDGDGDPLTWSVVTPAGHGVATVNPSSGLVTYVPLADYVGTDSCIVQVSDGRGGADAITINCTVTTTRPSVTALTASPAYLVTVGGTVALAATATPGSGHSIDHVAFSSGATSLGNGIYSSGTGTWNLSWAASSLGRTTITATAHGDDGQIAMRTVSVVVGTAGTFGNGGAPWTAGPGTLRLEAEHYDEGGEGAAFHDADSRQGTSTARSGGTANEVDLVAIAASTDSPGLKVGYTAAGEWLRYTVTVPAAGLYNLRLRVANGTGATSPNAVSLRWKGAVVVGPLGIPSTGGWDSFTDLDVPGVVLSAGTALFELDCNAAGFDVNWLEFTPVGPAPYAAWITGYYPGDPVAQTAATADPDGDGVCNLLEYGFGRAPDAAEPPLAPALWTDAANGSQYLALTFKRARGVAVVAEISDDLVAWSSDAANLVQVGTATPDPTGLYETVTFRSTATTAAKPRQFLRVRMTFP